MFTLPLELTLPTDERGAGTGGHAFHAVCSHEGQLLPRTVPPGTPGCDLHGWPEDVQNMGIDEGFILWRRLQLKDGGLHLSGAE